MRTLLISESEIELTRENGPITEGYRNNAAGREYFQTVRLSTAEAALFDAGATSECLAAHQRLLTDLEEQLERAVANTPRWALDFVLARKGERIQVLPPEPVAEQDMLVRQGQHTSTLERARGAATRRSEWNTVPDTTLIAAEARELCAERDGLTVQRVEAAGRHRSGQWDDGRYWWSTVAITGPGLPGLLEERSAARATVDAALKAIEAWKQERSRILWDARAAVLKKHGWTVQMDGTRRTFRKNGNRVA